MYSGLSQVASSRVGGMHGDGENVRGVIGVEALCRNGHLDGKDQSHQLGPCCALGYNGLTAETVE